MKSAIAFLFLINNNDNIRMGNSELGDHVSVNFHFLAQLN